MIRGWMRLKIKKRYSTTRTTPATVVCDVLIRLFFAVYVASVIYVLWQTVLTSISPEVENLSARIRFWTTEPSFKAYSEIWSRGGLGNAFMNNIYISVLGTLLHVLICTMAGYALAKPDYPFKQAMLTIIMISMLVPAQMTMVPTFTLYRSLNLINSLNSLLVSGLVSGFSIIVMRNYFLSVPRSLWESAKLDGAGEFTVFWRIYVPISKPGFATIITLQFVAKWNSFFDAVLFINDTSKQVLQPTLNNIILSISNAAQIGSSVENQLTFGQNVRSAAIVITMLPILILYPFMQKYLIKGMTVGAVKE